VVPHWQDTGMADEELRTIFQLVEQPEPLVAGLLR
jgi:hypothetical protein